MLTETVQFSKCNENSTVKKTILEVSAINVCFLRELDKFLSKLRAYFSRRLYKPKQIYIILGGVKKKIKILEVGLTKSFSPIYDLPIHKVKKGRVHLGGPLSVSYKYRPCLEEQEV